ncbi:hypothetical protein Tco_1540743 [Tanacetum coccineum]
MFYKKNVDFVALLWEDFMFQADKREISSTRKENMPYQDAPIKAATPKKARKFKKTALPSKRQTIVLEDEPAKKPKQAKHPEPAKEDVSSKKAQAKELKKVLKRRKKDTHMLHASRSDDGVGSQLKVHDELQDKITDDAERTIFDDEEEETQDDEFVHTLDDYVQTDNEKHDESDDVTEEEYERINEELYGDVNVSLTDAKPANKEKDDEEMTVVVTISIVNVNHECCSNQVKDDAQATQKNEGPIPSSSIS